MFSLALEGQRLARYRKKYKSVNINLIADVLVFTCSISLDYIYLIRLYFVDSLIEYLIKVVKCNSVTWPEYSEI